MKFEIMLTFTYEANPDHYPSATPEEMLEIDLDAMRTGLLPDDLPEQEDIVSITGRVTEP